jgi:hypothetical protein
MDTKLQQALDEFPDREPYSFELTRPNRLQLDQQYARRLAQDLSSLGVQWESRLAHASIRSELPDEPGLYMFVWRPFCELTRAESGLGERFPIVLYVGRAGGTGLRTTLRARFTSGYESYLGGHPREMWAKSPPGSREERLRACLTLRPLEYWWMAIPRSNEDQIQGLETRLIKVFDPPLNSDKRYRRPVLGKTTNAF